MTATTDTLPAPAKPRGGKSTREAVLRAATRLMHVRGYQNTSLDDVLRESGVGKGNFYHHFRSKEDLGYAILDQIVAVFLERTLEPCFSSAPSKISFTRCQRCGSVSLIYLSPLSSRWSHALAMLQSRLTVAFEIPITSAVSSTVKPLKKRSSTTLLCCSSIWLSRSSASSSATTSRS